MNDLTRLELFSDLEDVERAIACSTAFERYTDVTGGVRIQVTDELLALVDREQLVVAELQRWPAGYRVG